MNKENLKKIIKEFFRITGIFPRHRTNYVHDRRIRQDEVFPQLADKAFDYPKLLDILVKKAKEWLLEDKSELTCCLAGYIYYLKQDFKQAEACFLKAIEKNPYNLDNWLDLGFSLYHQDKAKQQLAQDIFFNFDIFIELYNKSHYQRCDLRIIRGLKRIIENAERSGMKWD
jgi:tetratricopeptide (TPR) repeat protein